MAIKLLGLDGLDTSASFQIAYRLTQVITFALLFSVQAAILVCDLVLSPNLKPVQDPVGALLDLVVVAVSYLGLITAMGSLTTRLQEHGPRTLYRQAALICSEGKKYDHYLDIGFFSFVTWLVLGAMFNQHLGSTPFVAGMERFMQSLVAIVLILPISLCAALLIALPKATKTQVTRLCLRLNRELTGMSGVDMKQANNLLTLLILQGKYKEADELSQKLISLAEQSPELIR